MRIRSSFLYHQSNNFTLKEQRHLLSVCNYCNCTQPSQFMNSIVFFALFLVLTSSVITSNCHSSCLTCYGMLSINCLSCDTSTFTFVSSGGLDSCVGITAYTTILEMIDTTWTGSTSYFTGIDTQMGLYMSASTLGLTSPPLTLSFDTPGTSYLGFNLASVPANHHTIQVRTHGTLPTNATCSWYSFSVDLNGNSIPDNVTGSDWFAINSFTDVTTAFQIRYTADSSQVCSSVTITDITVIMFLCLPNCATCLDGGTCSSCNYGLGGTDYFLDVPSQQCVSTCVTSYYVDISKNSFCDLCNTNCRTCVNATTRCTSCALSSIGGQLYLYNYTCIFTCRTGSFLNSTTNACDSCDISCSICTGSLSSQCQACTNATIGGVFTIFYLAIGQTQCSNRCPDGQYINSSFPNLCQPCSSNCLTCSSSPSTCLTCTTNLFLYNNQCLSVCSSGTYGETSNSTCVACDTACFTCFRSGPNSCYTCKANYYLKLGTTTCSSQCPAGQLNSSSVCLACSAQCATCSISISNCTTCSIVNGIITVFLYAGNCQTTCPVGFFGVVQASNNTCTACSSICISCSGFSSNCSSCTNVTSLSGGITNTTIYYKDPSLFLCASSCPSGYIISSFNNSCLQCASGCKTCQFNTSFCPQCQSVGSTDYYFYSNSCLILCPDGTFRNTVNYTCSKCAFFTFNQQCIQQCPAGYVGVLSGSVAICQACINCTYQDAPFSISSKVIMPSKNFMHEVAFRSGISKNCSASSIASSLQVYILSGHSSRLLASTTSLTVLSVSFSADYSTIIVVTNAGEIDISSASIGMTFLTGTVYTPSGIFYNTLSSTLSLQNPVFLDSYYHAFVEDKSKQIEGITFIIYSSLLFVLSLFLNKKKLTVSILLFVQTVQIIGLLRVKALPIVLQVYNVLVGFSFFQLSFIPNIITKVVPGLTLKEYANDAATFVYGSQNFINNFGSVIVLTLLMSLLLGIFWFAFREDDKKLQIVRLVLTSILQFWIVIIIYGFTMSLISLDKNSLTDSNALFTSSIVLSSMVLMLLLLFIFKQFQALLHTQFHRVSMLFKVVSLVVVAHRVDMALLCFNSFQILLTIMEFSFYNRDQKEQKLWLAIQKILGLIAIDSCLLVKDAVTSQIILGVTLSLIALYKSYQLIRQFAEYFNKKNVISLQADASASLKGSTPAKSEQFKLGQNIRSNPNYNSQNFLFDDTISQKYGEVGQGDKSMNELNDLKATSLSNNITKVECVIQPTIKQQYEQKQEEQVIRRRRKKIKEVKEVKYESPKENEVDQIQVIKMDHSQKASVAEKQQLSLPELQSNQSNGIQVVSVQ